MSIVKINIERVNEQKYEAQMDCSRLKQTGENRNLGDDEKYIAMLLINALKAVFGGECDLFDVYDILIECLDSYRPSLGFYLHAESINNLFGTLQKAWKEYDCDKGDFKEYFKKYLEEEEI